MAANESVEGKRAGREAVDAVSGRKPGRSSAAADEALHKYLAAERYHVRRHQPDEPVEAKAADGEDDTGR